MILSQKQHCTFTISWTERDYSMESVTALVILLFSKMCKHGYRSHKISLSPPLFIEVPVPSQESGRSCICVCTGYRYCLFFYDFSIEFLTAATVWMFFLF